MDVGARRRHLIAEGPGAAGPGAEGPGAAGPGAEGPEAEGPEAGGPEASGPALVWIPEGHAEGLSVYHFLQSFRDGNRSVLFDRFGTAWSNSGPFPRSTAREAEELVTLLAIAGEVGPLVPIGHSMDDSWL